MEMAFCSHCGADIGQNRFCPSCGTPAAPGPAVAGAPVTHTPTPQPQEPAPVPPATIHTQGLMAAAPLPAPPAVPTVRIPGGAKPVSFGAMASGGAGAAVMLLGAIGSALPWASMTLYGYSQTKNGLSGDGIITIITTLFALGFFLIGLIGRAKWPFIVSLVLCLITSVIAIYDAANLASQVSVGIGLWLVMISGVLGAVIAVFGIAAPRATA
jgi:hypothetical protein